MFPCTNDPIARLRNFRGLYNRGSFDNTPQDYLNTCNNCIFNGKDITIREGLGPLYATDYRCVQYFAYSAAVKVVSGIGNFNILYMDNTGKLYDAGAIPDALLATFTGANGFCAIEAFGRIYISPTLNNQALAGEFTYYWDGTNFAKVAGVAPVAGVTLAQANPGIVNAGVHGVYVSFLYRTGYLSPPSPVTNITSTGTNDIEVSVIPTGGAGVVGRVILMTLSNQTEPFFVPGGTINDNVTTTFVINVYDNSLLSSADYLFDVLPTIPSCSAIKFYAGRLLLVGRSDFPFILLWSDVGIYDSFNNINNIQNVPRDNNLNAPNTAAVINSVCYIFKPFGTYYTQDNGQVPNLWTLTLLDAGLGGHEDGISAFSSGLSSQDVLDSSFVVHPRGLLLFNGNYSDIPLSFNIDDLWKSFGDNITSRAINNYNSFTLSNDTVNKRLYVITNSGTPTVNGVLMMDYSEGLTYQTVRWSAWTFVGIDNSASWAACLFDQSNNYYVTFSSGYSGSNNTELFTLNSSLDYDITGANVITQQILTSLVFKDEGSMTCFNGLRFRVSIGSGNTCTLGITLYDEDQVNSAVAPNFILSNYTAQDLFRLINFTNEKMMVQLTSNNGGFSLSRLDVFGNKQWQARPALTQST